MTTTVDFISQYAASLADVATPDNAKAVQGELRNLQKRLERLSEDERKIAELAFKEARDQAKERTKNMSQLRKELRKAYFDIVKKLEERRDPETAKKAVEKVEKRVTAERKALTALRDKYGTGANKQRLAEIRAKPDLFSTYLPNMGDATAGSVSSAAGSQLSATSLVTPDIVAAAAGYEDLDEFLTKHSTIRGPQVASAALLNDHAALAEEVDDDVAGVVNGLMREISGGHQLSPVQESYLRDILTQATRARFVTDVMVEDQEAKLLDSEDLLALSRKHPDLATMSVHEAATEYLTGLVEGFRSNGIITPEEYLELKAVADNPEGTLAVVESAGDGDVATQLRNAEAERSRILAEGGTPEEANQALQTAMISAISQISSNARGGREPVSPVTQVVLANYQASLEAGNDPAFRRWRMFNGKSTDTPVSFNEYRRYQRNVRKTGRARYRAPSTGDYRLITHYDRSMGEDTAVGRVYFQKTDGTYVDPREAGQLGDAEVGKAKVVEFDLTKPAMLEAVGAAVVDDDPLRDVLTRLRDNPELGRARAFYDNEGHTLVVTGADGKVLYNEKVGNKALLDGYARDPLMADVAGSAEGYQSNRPDNKLENLDGAVEGEVFRVGPYIAPGIQLTKTPPTRETRMEVTELYGADPSKLYGLRASPGEDKTIDSIDIADVIKQAAIDDDAGFLELAGGDERLAKRLQRRSGRRGGYRQRQRETMARKARGGSTKLLQGEPLPMGAAPVVEEPAVDEAPAVEAEAPSEGTRPVVTEKVGKTPISAALGGVPALGKRDSDGGWNTTEAEDLPLAEVLGGGKESFVAKPQPSGTAARNSDLAVALSTSPLQESREDLVNRIGSTIARKEEEKRKREEEEREAKDKEGEQEPN